MRRKMYRNIDLEDLLHPTVLSEPGRAPC